MKKILVAGCFLLGAAAFAQNQQNNAQNNNPVQPAPVVAPAPTPAPSPAEAAPAPAEPQPVVAQPAMSPSPSPEPAPAPEWQIVGVGSDDLCAKHLLVRGCQDAVLEAKTCAISGHVTSGSQCFAVWQHNGGKLHSRYVSARDFGAMQDFIARTQSTCQLQYAPKHPKSECYDGIRGTP